MIRARKRFGQNFLEPAWVAKVIRAIDPGPDDTFLEIGPGRGALTQPLADRAGAVVAVEIDRDLAADLAQRRPPNVTVMSGDILEAATFEQALRTAALDDARRLRVAGNLPYNVASPILIRLRDLYADGFLVRDATVMLQREMADRLTARPGTRDYGVLTILVSHTARVERLLALPPGAFRPAPRIHSALVRLTYHAPEPPVGDLPGFERLVRSVFTRRRKTVENALLPLRDDAAACLRQAGLDGRRRPETLSIAEFGRLSDAIG
ncbi:MAG TPA: 16S rRNA (adenine(1518)-N(6)/adenine(1519)-N(6))-dimethyltransferase RsmA [Vicinamibacterales bacterium]|nr:16S rRNA (adenine(1518)-N(6)/adenine(1519)-N(6))-dimethyltransferase RsmA [Vicinamibacterales bacterium]